MSNAKWTNYALDMFAHTCNNNKEVFQKEWQQMRRLARGRGVEMI